MKQRHQLRVIAVAVLLGRLDRRQHAADRVHRGQQCRGDLGAERDLLVAQPAEQALGGVGDALQPRVTEEAAGPLDGVIGPTDARDRFARAWVLLQRDEVAVQPIEIFIALDQELFDDLFVLVIGRHSGPPPFVTAAAPGTRAARTGSPPAPAPTPSESARRRRSPSGPPRRRWRARYPRRRQYCGCYRRCPAPPRPRCARSRWWWRAAPRWRRRW